MKLEYAHLMVAALVMGGLAWVGAAWLARLVPRYALPSRRSQALRAAQAEAGEP